MRRKGALLLTRAMALPPDLSAGNLLLASCPVGDIANVYTLLNRIEYAVFAVVYFLTEVPLLLGLVAWYRLWWAPAGNREDLSDNKR